MDNQDAVDAEIRSQRSLSWIWLVPLIAALAGGWILYDHFSRIGPTITISFESASGVEPGKTRVKVRDVDVGVVKRVSLSADNQHVLVTVQMQADTERFLVEGSQFWIVSPRITHNSVSGLNTLLSGAYIDMSVGTQTAEKRRFIGLNEPPVTPVGTPGLRIKLRSAQDFAFDEGDPVIYRGLTVGKFEGVSFDVARRSVSYDVFINAPYHKLLTTNTRFWNASGVEINLDSDGISLRTGNAETLLTNGVAFDIPNDALPGEAVEELATYDIYPNEASADAVKYNESLRFVILISDSVRGLSVGAPVEYRGLQIGRVAEVNLHNPQAYQMLEQDYQIPVLLELFPGMAGLPDTAQGRHQMENQLQRWITTGLQASLSTGNLLTGKQIVDLQHFATESEAKLALFLDYPVIPTRAGDFTQITQKLSAILDKLNGLPLEQLSDEASETLTNITQTMQRYDSSGQKMEALLNQLNDADIARQISDILHNVNQLSAAYTEGSPGQEELNAMLANVNRTLRELQPLIQKVNNQPSSLVFPATPANEPVPGGKHAN
ncbi:intermembrane transport protein PqiB [Pseudobowmanella zhangzhouensis]|uniref:Intermembrane transport protein PqiB n=2 Tax=Alteromonadales TaxID=135622 RepID=A0ABW1XIQ8_9ALTE|nr:intermembrane transport protein PqiB [Bowmanella sp. JS7-9]TBX24570.1 hypothetical protein TK45_04690 [Bowmanella sp. JS7-9]